MDSCNRYGMWCQVEKIPTWKLDKIDVLPDKYQAKRWNHKTQQYELTEDVRFSERSYVRILCREHAAEIMLHILRRIDGDQ